MAAMERRMLGPKSEKLPPMDREVRKQRPVDPDVTQEKRRKNAELRATRVETETVEHKVPDEDRICPKCSGTKLRPVGVGKESIVVEYVPGYFRRHRHVRETLACPCGSARLLDRHPRPPRLASCRPARRAAPPELVPASLIAVSAPATITPPARPPNASQVGRLQRDDDALRAPESRRSEGRRPAVGSRSA